MNAPNRSILDRLRSRHDAAWRNAAEVASQWEQAGRIDPRLFRHAVRGAFWDVLGAARVTLLVTREYEHLALALAADRRGPAVTYMPLPHPSGLAVDPTRGVLHLASTRNPNQILDFVPAAGGERTLVPVRARYLPGRLYLHDLALIGGRLHASAVGQNAVVRLDDDGGFERVWWPHAIETVHGPRFEANYLQLNSIAAGPDLAGSFFSASAEAISIRRPGHRNFPVDRRGVVFSGATRAPVARGLTRPHSARLRIGRLWVDNSGYGEVGVVEDGRFTAVARLPGWTRGLTFHGDVAFVGTSRVLPRFRQYAPGLDLDESVCGVHAVDVRTGKVLGSITWPYGNQLFAVDWVPYALATGFPFAPRRAPARARRLFYAFERSDHER